jgi:hypothetical protein
MRAVGVSAGGDDDQVAQDTVRDVGFGAVEQPMIAHVHCAGLQTGQVAASRWLGHGYRQDRLARDDPGHEAVLLLVSAELGDVGRHQIAVEVDVEPDVAVAHVLFDDDLVEAKVVDPRPAVFLVCPDAE